MATMGLHSLNNKDIARDTTGVGSGGKGGRWGYS